MCLPGSAVVIYWGCSVCVGATAPFSHATEWAGRPGGPGGPGVGRASYRDLCPPLAPRRPGPAPLRSALSRSSEVPWPRHRPGLARPPPCSGARGPLPHGHLPGAGARIRGAPASCSRFIHQADRVAPDEVFFYYAGCGTLKGGRWFIHAKLPLMYFDSTLKG